MPIYVIRKDKTQTPYRNAELIPAFLAIPESILSKTDPKLYHICRTPNDFRANWANIDMVESDYFLNVLMDAYAYMVWPYMGCTDYMEIYSGYDPAWLIAHDLNFWVPGLEEAGFLPSPIDILRVKSFEPIPFVREGVLDAVLRDIVPKVMKKHNLYATIQTAKEYRCFEDFDYRDSMAKRGFHREWYLERHHIQTIGELYADRAALERRLNDLTAQRTKLQNKIRRATPEEKEVLRREKSKLTSEITEVRKSLKCNRAIEERSVHIQDTLDRITANEERAAGRDVPQQVTYEENEITTKKKERNYER